MSTLGKIVTVLVVVAAVFVGAMAAGYVQVSTDYRAALENTQGHLQKARQYNEAWRASAAAARTETAEARRVGKVEADALRGRIEALNASIKQNRDDVVNRDSILSGLKADVAKLSEELTALNAKATTLADSESKAKARADEYQEANARMAKEIHSLLTIRRDLESQLMQAQQRMAELEKSHRSLVQAGGEARTTTVAPLPAVNLSGVVTRVEPATGMVQIDIGASDGVVRDMTFLVQRGGRYMADLVVTKLDENTAIGVLRTVQGQVQEGDNVRYNVR